MRCVSRPLPRGRTFSCTSAHRKRARYARVCQYWLAEMRAFGAHLQGSRTPRCYNCICTAVTANARHRRAFSTAPPSKSADCLRTVSASLKRARGARVSSHRTGLHLVGVGPPFRGVGIQTPHGGGLCVRKRARTSRVFNPRYTCSCRDSIVVYSAMSALSARKLMSGET